jgi:hemerythrin-like domain-containing protein
MSKAIEDLKHEHEAILSSFQVLESMLTAIEKTSPLNPGDVLDFIGFLKEFADKCHHGKEEGLLFPALIGAGLPDRGGPVGAMMMEHQHGRQLIRQMEEAVSGNMDAVSFTRSAREYISLLQNHIQKENNILFPLAEKVLSEAMLQQLYKKFEEHEEKVIGHGRHEELHAMLDKLQQKYPA